MVATLLFAGITSLVLCFFASLAEDFMPHRRKSLLHAMKKPRAPKDTPKE